MVMQADSTHRPPRNFALVRRRSALRLLCVPGMLAAHAVLAQPLQVGANRPRIVSVSGAMTEIIYALGAEKQLVGTDTTSLFPSAALDTPKVGYMRQLSAEGLLSLRPDAVIGTTEAGPRVVLDQVRSAGVKVALVESDHVWGEVQRKVAAVGLATGQVAKAAAFQATLDARWADVLARVAAQRASRPSAVFILSHSATPQVAGAATAAHAMLDFARLRNAFSGGVGKASFKGYKPMTAEALVAAAPDVIVTTEQGIEASGGLEKFWARPGLEMTPAYRRRSLVVLDALLLMGFGPRLPEAVSALHDAAYKAVA